MTTPRPTQVTVAGWVVVAGSVVVVLMAFSEVAKLHSLDTRQEIEKYLSGSPGGSFGLGVQDVLTILRVASTVAAVCAASTAILGWYVLRRSRSSRLALSVLAVPLFLAGLLSGGVATAVVAAAVAMLWLQPARAWFDGVEPPRRAAAGPAPTSPSAPSAPTAPPPWPAPPPSYDRDSLLGLPPPTAPPVHPAGHPAAPVWAPPAGPQVQPIAPARRPGAVVWACVLTWTFASVAFVALALTLVVTVADTQAVLDQAHRQNPDLARQGISDTTIQIAVYVTSALVLLWAVAAAVLAGLAWRRIRWGAIGLLVSTIAAGGLGLLLALGSVVLLVPVAACATTVVLLLRPDVRRWYAARGSVPS